MVDCLPAPDGAGLNTEEPGHHNCVWLYCMLNSGNRAAYRRGMMINELATFLPG